ncbi:group II intron reverse transcriptase/maturase [Nocardia terpenica]|nr:group II intron reverse transcriptase/maturase [Nocardia terpenica]
MNSGELWLDSFEEAARQVRRMQIKLHWWATRDPGRVFNDLHNLVYDPAFLMHAWERVHDNKGGKTAGVDGVAPRSIPKGSTALLSQLRTELKDRSFRPEPVREKLIPKPGNPHKKRRLGIPTTRDRVVQAALKLVLEPIFEADFQPGSHGFRPRHRAQDAIADVHHFGSNGYHWILEGDIEACFDEISHPALMDRIRRRVEDKRVLALVKAFLKAGVLSEDGACRDAVTGTPQGGILSPLLANIALSVLDDHYQHKWEAAGSGKFPNSQRQKLRARGGATYRCIRYADDFLVMVHGTRQHAEQARSEVAAVLAPMGLHLSESKTLVTHIDCGFDFLGWRIQRRKKAGTIRKMMIYTYPSKKSLTVITGRIRFITRRSGSGYRTLKEMLSHLNSVVRGWCNYFRHGVSKNTFGYLNYFLWWRVTRWLSARHPRLGWRKIKRRFLTGTPAQRPEENGTVLCYPSEITVERYRWRGNTIPTPWSASITALLDTGLLA